MIRTELLSILNSGAAWAFVGSGPSVDSGVTTWEGMVGKVIDGLDDRRQQTLRADAALQKRLNEGDLIGALGQIEAFVGRGKLDALVRSTILDSSTAPSPMLQLIADLPFQGYITINYDPLLERALQEHGGGWIAVGNVGNEIKKVSGNVSEIVWHVHGAAEMGNNKSRLVITQKDYDDLYLEDTSTTQQLKALLSQHRIVIVGFGFRDPEVRRILKRIGRLTNPAQPIYAFVGGLSGPHDVPELRDLLHSSNVDVIPYDSANNHRQLRDLLGVYGSLVLRRSLKYTNAPRPCPSYDPETTGILLYNEFCLRNTSGLTPNIFELLVRARTLSLLRYGQLRGKEDLIQEVRQRAQLLRRDQPEAATAAVILAVLGQLQEQGLISSTEPLKLTDKGEETVADQSATAERLSAQFSSSLVNRCAKILPNDRDGAQRVSTAAETFLKGCVKSKALGVAMARTASRAAEQSFHMVALLQTLPRYMSELHADNEAIALSNVVQAVIANPTLTESQYIGLALQAQFGVHLLGVDPSTLAARSRDLTDTFFLFDSSVLIHLLARSSIGFELASTLVATLRTAGCHIATTPLFADEVAEHARYAATASEANKGRATNGMMEAATEKGGHWLNAFVDGFLKELGESKVSDIYAYLSSIFRTTKTPAQYSRTDVERELKRKGFMIFELDEPEGFTKDIYAERDEVQQEIAAIRTQRGTYKHERQVKAEAEAHLLTKYLRCKQFKIEDQTVSNAYFVSHTRIIDDVQSPTGPATQRPEALLQWVNALRPCNIEELRGLTETLLWELKERGLAIVDRTRLRTTFQPQIDASREHLDQELERHHELIQSMYGISGEEAIRQAPDVELPLILDSITVQETEELHRRYEQEKASRIAAQAQAALAKKDREELNLLRSKEKERERRGKSRKRAAASRRRKNSEKRKKSK